MITFQTERGEYLVINLTRQNIVKSFSTEKEADIEAEANNQYCGDAYAVVEVVTVWAEDLWA